MGAVRIMSKVQSSVYLFLTLVLVTQSSLALHEPLLQVDTGKEQQLQWVESADRNTDDMKALDISVSHAKKNVTIPDAASKLGLKTLVTDIEKAKLKKSLEGKGPLTLFGPTDEAFENLPPWAKKEIENTTVLAEVLKFHVLRTKLKSADLQNELLVKTSLNETVRINIYKTGKRVVVTAQCAPLDPKRVDQPASNGIIHVLNAVMLPPAGNLVTALAGQSDFSILVSLVSSAGLAGTLSSNGPFTVFTPTNAAFAKLPPGTVEKMLYDPRESAKILKYHVVAGTLCSSGLTSAQVETVEGHTLKVTVSKGAVTVNNAKVTSPDGSVTNGVYHVIDTVLLPPPPVLIDTVLLPPPPVLIDTVLLPPPPVL